MRGDGRIVHLTMVEAAFLAREHFQRLLFGADGIETSFCDLERNLLVALAVQQEERAGHLLHDAVEAERLEFFHRRSAIGNAEYPLQMFGRYRQRRHLAGFEGLEALHPDLMEIPLRAPGDAAGKTRLQ